ncbi:MAG: hypothetical protein H6741_24175 [Alphaproteobacteria bacterium]|nr:hypothetical protein [Alphaproteobacteria bacterium]
MHRDQLRIPEPCHADWGEMSGDERQRFCQSCAKHVHDLSAMTERQARRVLEEPKVCVRYTVEPDGQVRFQPSRRRRMVGAVAAAAGLALALPATGCSTAQANTQADVSEPNLLEKAATALHDWLFGPEEGCKLNDEYEVENVRPVLMGEPMPILEPEPAPPEPEVLMGDVAFEPEPPPPPEPTMIMGKIALPSPAFEPEPPSTPAPLTEVTGED